VSETERKFVPNTIVGKRIFIPMNIWACVYKWVCCACLLLCLSCMRLAFNSPGMGARNAITNLNQHVTQCTVRLLCNSLANLKV
jgi:hypothetical protein